MSLIGALNIGKSALATHQAAIQVIGNNIANAGNADYTRQVATLSPAREQQTKGGLFVGSGINIDSVTRQIDEALMGRLRGSISENASADTMQQWLGRVEAAFNELSDQDLSTQLSKFFGSWSELANRPEDTALRQVVIQDGQTLADSMQHLRRELTDLKGDIETQITGLVGNADRLAQTIAKLNGQIQTSEGGGRGEASGLRDQRDAALKSLAQLVDVKTSQGDGGAINVFIGSQPLVIGADCRGLSVQQQTADGKTAGTVIFKNNGATCDVRGGQIGALTNLRTEQFDKVIGSVDSLAGNLIFELNKLHASGQGTAGFTSVTGTNQVDDLNVALNSTTTGLAFKPVNGSFVVHVKGANGSVTSTLVQVDLDGLNGNDTTLNSLATQLDGIAGISASTIGGKLKIQTDSSDNQITFSQDSSGTLAALGVNTFFSGRSALDIDVNAILKSQPALLAAAQYGTAGGNETARAIAALESAPLASLNGATLQATYEGIINGVAVSAGAAKADAQSSMAIRETLEAQREALSGVSLDEEAINLMKEQRAFQGAAKLIAAVDEMMRTILNLV